MWLSVLIVVLAIFAFTVLPRRRTFKGKAPPEYPGAWPIIGHAHLLASTPHFELHEKIAKASEASGGVIGYKLGSNQIYTICDPEDSVTVLNACLGKNFLYDFMKPGLGEGLVTAKLPIWKKHRKLLSPAFNQTILDGFLGVFNSQGLKLARDVANHADGKTFDCHELLDRNTLETVCLTIMGGANAQELLNNDYLAARERAQNIVINRFQSLWLHSDFIFNLSSLKKPFVESIKIIHGGSYSVINKNRKKLRENSINAEKTDSKFKTFIDLIIENYGANGGLTDQEIREEVDTMIAAGNETTALTLMFTLILLGSHPEVQEQAFKEISEVIGEKDVEKQDFSKLVYLEAVLKEAMRLYPIVPFVYRELTEDVKLKNYTLCAGSSAQISIYTLHRHVTWGTDVEQFAPARWIDKRIPAHTATYMPFSFGKRNCIGKTFAMMSMKIYLVHLIRNFRFSSDVSKLKVTLDIVLKPASGHYITVEKRK